MNNQCSQPHKRLIRKVNYGKEIVYHKREFFDIAYNAFYLVKIGDNKGLHKLTNMIDNMSNIHSSDNGIL